MVFGLGKKKRCRRRYDTADVGRGHGDAVADAQQGGNRRRRRWHQACSNRARRGMPPAGMPAPVANFETANSSLTKKEQKALAREQKKAARARKEEKAYPASEEGCEITLLTRKFARGKWQCGSRCSAIDLSCVADNFRPDYD